MDRKGKAFKGRACAEKVNADYRRMQADMYNLYPAIGSVNAVRSNKNFQMLGPDVPSAFGSCPMKISGNKVEPPERARGQIARSSLYMADSYSEPGRDNIPWMPGSAAGQAASNACRAMRTGSSRILACLWAFGRSRRQFFFWKAMKAFFEEMQVTGRKKLDEGTYHL